MALAVTIEEIVKNNEFGLLARKSSWKRVFLGEVAKITNGFSHYFNIRHDRSGHLFQGNFGAVRIEDDEQFTHVSRYIHLNPVTSYLIEVENLASYEYSSYPEYINKSSGFTNVKEALSYFNNPKEYKEFVKDQADYSKKLADIEHLTLENLE